MDMLLVSSIAAGVLPVSHKMRRRTTLPLIAQRLKQNVKRNFTRDEWNYYVGKGIPYRELRIKSCRLMPIKN